MKRSLFLLLLLSSTLSWSQSALLFNESRRQSYLFRSNSSPSIAQVINRLAQAQGRPANIVDFTLETEQQLRVLREGPQRLNLTVDIRDLRLRGQFQVQGFDVEQFLMPSTADLTFLFTPLDGLRPAPLKFESNRPIRDRTVERATVNVNDSVSKRVSLELQQVRFNYDAAALRALDDYLDVIREYYATDPVLNQVASRLSTVNPGDVEALDFHNATLTEAEGLLQGLSDKDLYDRLPLEVNDPIQFRRRLTQLQQDAAQRRIALNQTRATLHLYYYQAGLRLADQFRYAQAREAFRRSLVALPVFAPAAYQIALIDYRDGRIHESECRVREILENMDPDPDTRALSGQLAASIYQGYIRQADVHLGSGRWEDALDPLMKARNLCQDLSDIRCDARLDSAFRQARGGVYRSMLDQARIDYQAGDVDGAERKIRGAIDYQDRFARYIPNSLDAKEMLNGVYRMRFDRMLDTSDALVRQRQSGAALKKLEEAGRMQQQYGFELPDRYLNLRRAAAKPLVLSALSDGNGQAAANDLVNARRMLSEALALQSQNGLEHDADINAATDVLRKRIFSRECENAQRSMDSLGTAARLSMERGDFLRADEQLERAIRVASDNSDCALMDQAFRSVRDSIRPAVAYQSALRKVLTLQSNGQYTEATEAYLKAGADHPSEFLSRFGLSHAALLGYAQAQGSSGWLIHLIDHFLNRADASSALMAARQLLLRNVPAGDYRQPLIRLGRALAFQDRQQGVSGDWKSAVLKHTQGDKRLKPLEKGYKDGWKKSAGGR
jgi:tetratricopeptide (TPR) repeat protein